MTSVERFANRVSGIESEITGMLRARQLPASTVVTTAGDDLPIADVLGAAQDVADAAPEQAESIFILDDAQSVDLDASMEEEAAREATDDEAHEARMHAIFGEDRSNEIDAELKETGERLSERQERLELELTAAGERINAGEESQAQTADELAALDALLAQVNDLAGAAKDDAGKALEMAPLTTEKLLAVIATIGEAFIGSGHIVDLDAGKLVVTGETVLNEAVINELFAKIITAKILEVTEKLIGVDGTFTGKLTADHLDVKTLFGQRIDGLEIHGGEFVQYATDTMLPIYPASAGDVVVEDWFGGAPDGVAAAVAVATPVFSGSTAARVHRAGPGSVSAVWRNADRVPRVGAAARRVEVRVRSTVPLTGVHINTPAGRADLPNLPANTWQVIAVELPQGADLAWLHVGGVTAASGQTLLYIDEVRVLSASLQGAHVRISRDASGLPGVFIYNAAGEVLGQLTPNGVKTVDPVSGSSITMSRDLLEFQGARMAGQNVFQLKSQLEAWNAPDGTRAWVVAENREYVRIGGIWRPLPDHSHDTAGWVTLTGQNGASVDGRRVGDVVTLRLLGASISGGANAYVNVATIPSWATSTGARGTGSAYKQGGTNRSGHMEMAGSVLRVLFSESFSATAVSGTVTYLV